MRPRPQKNFTCVGMWRNMQFFKRFSSFFSANDGNACLRGRLCFKSVYSVECDVIDLCKNKFAETFRGSLLSEHFINHGNTSSIFMKSSALKVCKFCGNFSRNILSQSFNEVSRESVRKSSEKFLIKTSQWSEVMRHKAMLYTQTRALF